MPGLVCNTIVFLDYKRLQDVRIQKKAQNEEVKTITSLLSAEIHSRKSLRGSNKNRKTKQTKH